MTAVRGDARCTLWWHTTPLHRGRRTGFIGRVESSDDDDLAALLARAADRLRDAGCDLAVGPGPSRRGGALASRRSKRMRRFATTRCMSAIRERRRCARACMHRA